MFENQLVHRKKLEEWFVDAYPDIDRWAYTFESIGFFRGINSTWFAIGDVDRQEFNNYLHGLVGNKSDV